MATLELNTNLLVEIGGWPALKEARALVERGRVTEARREGDVIRARVQGAEKIHEPQITLAERIANIEVRCTCAEFRRAGRVCPHALAAGYALLHPKVAAAVPSGGAVGSRRPPGEGSVIADVPSAGPSPGGRRLPTEQQDRPKVLLRNRPDGGLALFYEVGTRVPSRPTKEPGSKGLPPLPQEMRVVPYAQMPDFLTREWPAMERNSELVFAPGFEEFRLEIGQPTFEARLDGALSGLTLELVARYGDKEFPLSGKTEPSAYQRYLPDAQHLNRFWRRNVLAERQALAQVEAAGFMLARSGATTFALAQETKVTRFLANTLPRWRQVWTVAFGARLEATMAQIDIAEPEFSLRSGSGEDWLSLDLKLSVKGKPVPLDPSEIQRWLQTGQSHGRMANKRVLLVPTEAWGEMKEVLADCAVNQEPGKIRVARTYAPFLSGALTAQGFRDGENVAALVRAWPHPPPYGGGYEGPNVRASLDEKLWTQLRPYQAQGVEWLAGLAQQNFHGLLADDMGLGKTLQALAFAAWLGSRHRHMSVPGGGSASHSGGPDNLLSGSSRTSGTTGGYPQSLIPSPRGTSTTATDEGILNSGTNSLTIASCSLREPGQQVVRATQNRATLVVCPTSLVTNWLREAARFTPHLRTLDLTGADRAEKWAKRKECDLLVTSYAILRRDIELYRAEEFSLVILDEAQHIKNRSSQNAQSAKALRAQHRLILTGTPLENSVLDLWSLYDFLLPGYLGSAADFKERYETPLLKSPEPKTMERLRHRVKPFFLRRTKEEVLTELPPKLDYPTLCELSDEQREVYRAVLAQGRRDVFEHSGKSGNKGQQKIAVLTTLLRLRQVCCHLDLLPGGEKGDGSVVAAAGPRGGAVGSRRSPSDGSAFPSGGPDNLLSGSSRTSGTTGGYQQQLTEPPRGTSAATNRWKEPSAKMERTFELIDEAVDGGHRVLLFSQFVQVLHLLRDEAKRRDLNFCYLDGQTVQRQAEVDRFQNDATIPIFFISLKAGGTGLNLTGADTVIHFDPWWNPAMEEQATARAHRMGQARRVSAYKLIAAGTVEEKIQALQARKRELFEASLGGDEAFVEKLSGEDLEELLDE